MLVCVWFLPLYRTVVVRGVPVPHSEAAQYWCFQFVTVKNEAVVTLRCCGHGLLFFLGGYLGVPLLGIPVILCITS